ncbi:MAG: hypothetical protein IJ751_05605 [Oscillospiraceae bacterium]|nr:hypothetical protein [Oscillospiraceae bacterium]
MRQMKILIIIICIPLLTACQALPRHTDAADEAILRTIALGREGERMILIAATGGEQSGEETQPPEVDTGEGTDYASARDDLKEKRQASLVHVTDWVVEPDALPDALAAFVADPELTYSARIYVLRDQTARAFMDAFDGENPAVKALEDLDRAREERGVTVLELSADLAAGRPVSVPLLVAEDGTVEVRGEMEIGAWR